MQIFQWLDNARKKINSTGITSSELDSLLLLEYVLSINRASILAHPEITLTQTQITKLAKLLKCRLAREPLAYILGHKEFFGRDFIVNPDALIPRPESESFIEILKKQDFEEQTIIDIGCGSGVLGITTKIELPSNTVILSDVSDKALSVAKQNIQKHSVDCRTIKANLLPASIDANIIVANLPYVPINLKVQPELNFEPAIALYAKDGGMELYQKLWSQISTKPSIHFVLTESLVFQHNDMAVIAKSAGFLPDSSEGLVQLFKRKSS